MDRSIVVAGLGFGDECKGSIVDACVRKRKALLVVRFNGGPNAQHNVVLPDGTHFQFSSFGSGTLAGAATLLSRHVLVEPLALANEAKALWRVLGYNPYNQLAIDENCLVITPYHILAGRAREKARGNSCHGSCGIGIGETVSHSLKEPETVLRVKDLRRPASELHTRLTRIIAFLSKDLDVAIDDLPAQSKVIALWQEVVPQLVIVPSYHALHMIRHNRVVFEGSQGALLDQDVGFHPYTTWSKTLPDNALALCEEAGVERPFVLGLTRTYMTRHGLGPFPTENIRPPGDLSEPHTQDDSNPGRFRVGCLDLNLLEYAGAIVKPDGLAISHMDKLQEFDPMPVCTDYFLRGPYMGYESNIGLKRIPEKQSEQVRITKFLNNVDCHITATRGGEIPKLIRDAVSANADIAVYSHGPTWEHKRFLEPFE